MPSSDPRVLTETAREIILAAPRTVLDIGVGFGKWGVLAREYTDIWNYRFYKPEWTTFITGIEVHDKYRSPAWDCYDMVLTGKAQDVVKGLRDDSYNGMVPRRYNLSIMIDVLEHFEKDEGQKFLDDVMGISDKFLVSYCNTDQVNVRDNKFEDHVSRWEDSDFERFDRRLVTGGPGWGVYLLEKDKILC
jgi:hypothetical protein